MASIQDVSGVNQTLVDAGGLATIARGLIDGRVKVRHDTYVADATESAGSTIKFGGALPEGAKILLIVLAASAAQTSLTYQLGTSYNADEFIATGANGLQTATTPIMINGKGYVVGTADSDDQILLTTEAATMTAGTIYCVTFYTTD